MKLVTELSLIVEPGTTTKRSLVVVTPRLRFIPNLMDSVLTFSVAVKSATNNSLSSPKQMVLRLQPLARGAVIIELERGLNRILDVWFAGLSGRSTRPGS
jgi:hypothetical protein